MAEFESESESKSESESPPQTMYACICREYGPADQVFEIDEQFSKPILQDPRHVIVQNRWTTVNPADCKQRSGNLEFVLTHTFPLILGQDFAGTVVEVGAEVAKWKVGDEVFGSTAPRNGCAAEYICAFEEECARKPMTISWQQAVASPTSFCTAWRGLFDQTYGGMEINPPYNELNKKRVLIVGASGSVGSAAVQLAVSIGKADVTAICGAKNAAYVESLGASHVVDYSNDFASELRALDKSFDIILDCVGGDDYYFKLYPFLSGTTGSYYVTCVGPVLHGGSEPISAWTVLHAIYTLVPRFLGNYLPGTRNSRYKMYLDFTTQNGTLDQVTKALEDGKISPRIDSISTLPLNQMGKGHLKVESGHSDGKVLIDVRTTSKS